MTTSCRAGTKLHLKKVKANAQLGVTTLTPESFTRWKSLGAALALAALLGWLGRVAERCGARRAVLAS